MLLRLRSDRRGTRFAFAFGRTSTGRGYVRMATGSIPPQANSAVAALPRFHTPLKPARAVQAALLGTGSAVPPRVIDNHYFSETLGLDTSAEWIASRTGIRQRRYADADVRASDLALQAAEAALVRANMAASALDVLIVATSTPDFTMPSTACLLQQRLGAERAMAFDVVNACAGFVYALDVALRYLHSGMESALVIGADLGSRLVSPRDRTTSVFFGDAAAAVVLSTRRAGRVLASAQYACGESESLWVPVGGAMTMDGKAIWNFATQVLPDTVRRLCEAADVPVSRIKLLVPHQANANILWHAADALGLPPERVVMNLDRYGNTLAASIPLALDEALRDARAQAGDLIALVGFGAGLAWGGMLWEL